MSEQDPDTTDFDRAVRTHDEAVAAMGLAIWVGTEPTFTDRFSEAPEWLSTALGEDKASRAEQLLCALQTRTGGLVLRTRGRQYPGEDEPRWSLGLYARRDGAPIWHGPPDPALGATPDSDCDLGGLHSALCTSLRQIGCGVRAIAADEGCLHVVARFPNADQAAVEDDPNAGLSEPMQVDPALEGPGLEDPALDETQATDGLPCFVLDRIPWQGAQVARVELPDCESVEQFARCLAAIGNAAANAGLPALLLTGHPPPVDATVSWTTITPDPAVIEINMAPYPDVTGLLAATRTLYAASSELGLAPYRLYYNGAVADSGGGGQITFGGPSPQASPFFGAPLVLPRLVRYLNRHPALSYLFAHDHIGSSGQAVRTDERGRDAFRELGLALALLERGPPPDAETLWSGLSHLLTDAIGNSHRAELNIEKLWNPYLPGRGKLGLVEFRALRMQHTPGRAAALAALLRAIIAMLCTRDLAAPLCDHGDDLHDRYALPYYLERDLEEVFADLRTAGLGLDAPLAELLRRNRVRLIARVQHRDCELTIRRAVEFWPLIGDVGRQDQETSRLVDASTTRLEICLRAIEGTPAEDFHDWRLAVDRVRLPWRAEQDPQGPAKVFGLRYRSFVPWQGLHPALPAQGPLSLTLWHPGHVDALHLTLHDWRPSGGGYDGLPADLAEAAARRAERCVAESASPPAPETLRTPPPEAVTPYALDMRWLALGLDNPDPAWTEGA
ncbi:transglutaminase family protein [Thiocapsa bogorovii]|uniref:transglutaminase family protein n=1 Tax=Thiocapsa bogorovii TaxID=521689 RepID=UPI001E5BCB95|nr:transglutaminase family protein [Thiocapsa bogorovii]UHD18442.1 transglutaminase family protein [Thiocapsa bogorovii]